MLKKWKKMSAFLLAMLLSLSALSACSSDELMDAAVSVGNDVLSSVVDEVVSEALSGVEDVLEIVDEGVETDTAAVSETGEDEPEIEEDETEEAETETETAETETETAPDETEAETSEEAAVSEDGEYTDKESVALYIHLYGHLPGNYISKNEAQDLGWSGGDLYAYADGKSIGGSKFGNYEGILPKEKGRQYYECDIDYHGGKRNAKRIVYSNDGLIYYTGDHYETFELLYD